MPAEQHAFHSDSSTPAVHSPLTTALWCAERGWPVHPLAPGRKVPVANCVNCRASACRSKRCPCLAAGRWCHGFHAATLDQLRIRQWWGKCPDLGVGVACGPAGLVIIDVDVHRAELPSRDRILPGIAIGDQVNLGGLANGFHSLAVLAALCGQSSPADDATTLRVRTPSGGVHVWYRTADGRRWQCSSGSSQGRALAWQVDVRAQGGYIIAPGTTTRHGVYTPLDDVREPAPLPAWLAAELERTGHLSVPLPRGHRVPPRAEQAVLAAGGGGERLRQLLCSILAPVEACGRVQEGAGFSDALNRAAYTLGGLVAAGRVTHERAKQVLRQAAVSARPGQDRRIDQIMRSGMAAGSRHPLYAGRRGSG
ncbi:bifunctional DNA primase/polymerase [Streptomyces sp. NPDC057375]|uniref:bifunctional DNA primase/polymerase n=1 Tax=Streptomyces sp. NPDC057375 TaxID=3346109 RepID=UPI003636208F